MAALMVLRLTSLLPVDRELPVEVALADTSRRREGRPAPKPRI